MSDGPGRFLFVGICVNGIVREEGFNQETVIYLEWETLVLFKKLSDGMRLSSFFRSAGW